MRNTSSGYLTFDAAERPEYSVHTRWVGSGQFLPPGYAQLGENAVQMTFHGADGHALRVCDFPVGIAFPCEPGDIHFPLCELRRGADRLKLGTLKPFELPHYGVEFRLDSPGLLLLPAV